jgi:hypothetical protein
VRVGHLTAPQVPPAQTAASYPAEISRARGTRFQTWGMKEGQGQDTMSMITGQSRECKELEEQQHCGDQVGYGALGNLSS